MHSCTIYGGTVSVLAVYIKLIIKIVIYWNVGLVTIQILYLVGMVVLQFTSRSTVLHLGSFYN